MENYPYTSAGTMTMLNLFFALYFLSIQLSIHGAVADLCEEFVAPLACTSRPVAVDKSESTVTSNDLLNIQRPLLTNEQEQGDLLQNHKERLEIFLNDGQLVKICADAGFIKRLLPNSIF